MKLVTCILLTFTFSQTWAQIPSDIGTENVTSISNNLGIFHAGDGSGRLFTPVRSGSIRIIDSDDNLLPTPFLNISSIVNSSPNERGLLGLAFHPDYENNGFFYVNYTKNGANSGDTIVARYTVSQNDPNVADPNSAQVLMRIIQDNWNHNGGNMAFGPDGYLYIGMGDGGGNTNANDDLDRAQDLSSALGKMLRIDVDNDNPPSHSAPAMSDDPSCPQNSDLYAIPVDNPFISTPGACPEIWAYGLRNPWRWSFDKETGDMFIADVGQSAWEEVNFQPAASTGGEHYGWNCKEGSNDFQNGNDCADPRPEMVDPVHSQDHNQGRCSITGGFNYRGPVSSLKNRYIYGDYCSGQIWIASYSNDTWSEDEWTNNGASAFGITSFGEDEIGNVYVTVGDNIYRITGDDTVFSNGFEAP